MLSPLCGPVPSEKSVPHKSSVSVVIWDVDEEGVVTVAGVGWGCHFGGSHGRWDNMRRLQLGPAAGIQSEG